MEDDHVEVVDDKLVDDKVVKRKDPLDVGDVRKAGRKWRKTWMRMKPVVEQMEKEKRERGVEMAKKIYEDWITEQERQRVEACAKERLRQSVLRREMELTCREIEKEKRKMEKRRELLEAFSRNPKKYTGWVKRGACCVNVGRDE